MSFATTPLRPQPWRPDDRAGRAGLPVGALNGVRTRRMLAVCLDLVLVSILTAVLYTTLFVLTFGLSLLLLPPLFPFVAFFYNGFSVSGRSMGTIGMRAFDLEMRLNHSGGRVPFLAAAVHAVLFYLSWMVPVVFLWSLFSDDKRCLHDIFADVLILRRCG
jgi:uncharacterized RDD family membrane protein YckC